MDSKQLSALAPKVASALTHPDWRDRLMKLLPPEILLGTSDVGVLFQRDKGTISTHARARRDSAQPIGHMLNPHQWVFSRDDLLQLAEIIVQGPGRRPTKFVTPPEPRPKAIRYRWTTRKRRRAVPS